MKNVKEIGLTPYSGRLFYARKFSAYQKAHRKLFSEPDVVDCSCGGRFAGGAGKDGLWKYLVWAEQPHTLAHEMSHVVLHVFERCGIDPRQGNGEPFCYMLSQLILESQHA